VFGVEVAGVVALGLAAVGVEAEGDIGEGGDDVACGEEDGEERCRYGVEHGLHGYIQRARKTSWTATTDAGMRASRRYQYFPAVINDWG
jgi:hypothetical protein